ncbi:hypothetical protein DPMN_026731 [Dreissena polymorpha]|uniref:Uncharacterized protein n=1 Tax=Dreissena polymorpha TaxID=45954 RepID=A0A9D4LTZ7_DREPO|nr:hypothetical protein DPMN_026731 [Dreissena polymorpha]
MQLETEACEKRAPPFPTASPICVRDMQQGHATPAFPQMAMPTEVTIQKCINIVSRD